MAYTGERLNVEVTLHELERAARRQAFTLEALPLPGPWPLWAMTREAATPEAPKVYLSSGIHGDEPAGPAALLKLLAEGKLRTDFHWTLFPLLCPANMATNRRENHAGIDPNRDYRDRLTDEVRAQTTWLEARDDFDFDVAFFLHEDWESPGCYLYEQCPHEMKSLADSILQTGEAYCGLNLSRVIEGLPARNGLISTRHRLPEIEDWPEAIYMYKKGARRCYTLETPSDQPLDRRVAAHYHMLLSSLKELVPNR